MVYTVRCHGIRARLRRGDCADSRNYLRARRVRLLSVPSGLARNACSVPYDSGIHPCNVHFDGRAWILHQYSDAVRFGAFHRRGGGRLHCRGGTRTVSHRNARPQLQGSRHSGDEGCDKCRYCDNACASRHLRAGRLHERHYGPNLPAVLRNAVGGGVLLNRLRTYACSRTLFASSS